MPKVFEDEFMDCQSRMIALCEELTEGRVDKIYVYCCMEECEKMFDVFFSKNNEVLTVVELKIPIPVQCEFQDLGLEDIAQIEEVCKKHGRPSPTEIKMIFDIRTRSLQTKYLYQEYLDAEDKCAEEVYDAWIEEVKQSMPQPAPAEPKRKFPFFWRK